MDGVGLAAPPHARRRGRDARLRPAVRRRRRALGAHRPAARPRLRALSGPRRRPSRDTPCASSRRAAIRPSWSARSPRTPTSWASRARRRWRRRCSPSTSCRASSSPCAYVRPEGLVGMTPKSVKKKLKQPSFAAAVNRDELPRGRRGARRRLRRAPRDRDRRAGRAARRADAGRGAWAAAGTRRSSPRTPERRDADGPPDQDRRPGGRRDRPGAARAVAARARPRAARARARRFERFDLSLEHRRATVKPGRRSRPPRRCARPGSASRRRRSPRRAPATSARPNRILREEVDGKVIVRTGRRLPGVAPIAGVHYPISVVRMAVDDAYGAERVARGRGRRGRRGRLPHRADHALDLPGGGRVRVPDRRARWAPASTAARSGPSRRSTRGCSRRRWTPPPRATPTSTTGRS